MKARTSRSDATVPEPIEGPDLPDFDPDVRDRMRSLAALGLTPASALELLTHLIGQVPGAKKDTLDRLKLLDKFLNTARGMMETRLKTEEAVALAARLDEIEARMALLQGAAHSSSPEMREVWHHGAEELGGIEARGIGTETDAAEG
jgi:hypothetical protein